MKKPGRPLNESARLEALASYAIMETAPEAEFDNLAWVAGQVAEMPVAFISFVDDNRQWIKAKIGTQLQQSPRDLSFCGHVVASGQLLEVPDLTKDERFEDHPIVTGAPCVRFYAGFPLTNDQGQTLGALCVVDVKPRKLSENQRRSLSVLADEVTQRVVQRRIDQVSAPLRAMGELSGNLAHEINNPLSIISGRVQLIERALLAGKLDQDRLKKDVEILLRTCDRMGKIVKGFLKISRDGSTEPMEPVPLLSLVEEVAGLFHQKMIHHQVSFEAHGPADLILECRAIEILQLLINLVGNAVDALSTSTEKKITVSWKQVGETAELSVEDSGPGIPDSMREQIMRPFFTTKPIGQGTGLGLSICQKICQAHSAQLTLDSQSPHTRFVVVFPLLQTRLNAA